MRNSSATEEIREIRDGLSLRLLTMTPEERGREFQEAVDSFGRALGNPVTTANHSRSAAGSGCMAAIDAERWLAENHTTTNQDSTCQHST